MWAGPPDGVGLGHHTELQVVSGGVFGKRLGSILFVLSLLFFKVVLRVKCVLGALYHTYQYMCNLEHFMFDRLQLPTIERYP